MTDVLAVDHDLDRIPVIGVSRIRHQRGHMAAGGLGSGAIFNNPAKSIPVMALTDDIYAVGSTYVHGHPAEFYRL
ncbi:MAG TPA: hypothetical protein VID51_01345 [Solirubrobacterales bacterium]|jgi:hypothetical protein